MHQILRRTLPATAIMVLLAVHLVAALPATAAGAEPRDERSASRAAPEEWPILQDWLGAVLAWLGVSTAADPPESLNAHVSTSGNEEEAQAPPCAGACTQAGVMGDPDG